MEKRANGGVIHIALVWFLRFLSHPQIGSVCDLDALDEWRNRGRHKNRLDRSVGGIGSVPRGEAAQKGRRMSPARK